MRYINIAMLLFITISTSNAFAKSYYVKNGGNDNADGTSDATAWATVGKVNKFSFSTGDDVYFKAGDTWSGADLAIDWSGTSGDRVVVGSYYMSGSETVGVPGGTSKPTIQGGYTTKGIRGTVPSSQYGGLIVAKGNYVTIQNLRAIDSSGYGITISKGNDYCIIENTESHHHIGANYFVFNGSDYAILRNNKGTQANRKTTDKVLMADGSKIYNSHPPAMGFNNSQNSLAENNEISDAPAEGITFRIGTRNSIMRGNVIADLPLVGLYIQGGYNNILENNLLVNSGGINVITESSGGGYDATDIIIRNNLLSGTGGCFATAVWPEAQALGSVTSGKFIGNTCIAPNQTAIRFGQGTAASFESWEIANNIVYDADQGTGLCSALTDGDIYMHHNLWGTTPSDADCQGAGDISGNPSLNTSADFRNFSYSNRPTVNDFMPKSNSPVIAKGTIHPELTNDYNGLSRTSAPTIGALEVQEGSSISSVSVSVPTGLTLSVIK